MEGQDSVIALFNTTLKTKPFEQFGLLLCDLEKCENRQRELLHALLYSPTSLNAWWEYISYVEASFPDKKLQLQRLFNKSFEFIDEAAHKDNEHYLDIHIRSAQLKSSLEEVSRYFHAIIWRRGICIGKAAMYIAWAEAEAKLSGPEAGLLILQKALKNNAQPTNEIKAKLNSMLGDENCKASALNSASVSEEEVRTSNFKTATTTASTGSSKDVCIDALVRSGAAAVSNAAAGAKAIDSAGNDSGSSSSKTNLSKYIDDKLLNFNAKQLRSKSKSRKIGAAVKAPKSTAESGKSDRAIESSGPVEVRPTQFDVAEVELQQQVQGTSKGSKRCTEEMGEGSKEVKGPSVSFIDLSAGEGQAGTEPQDTAFGRSASAGTASAIAGSVASTGANVLPLIDSGAVNISTTAVPSCNGTVAAKRKRVSFISNCCSPSNKRSLPTGSELSAGNINKEHSVSISVKCAPAVTNVQSSNKDEASKELTAHLSNNHRTLDYNKPVSSSSSSFPSLGKSPGPGGSFGNILEDAGRTITLNDKYYTRLNLLGKGGSSSVFRIISQQEGLVFAYKRVDLRAENAEDSDAVLDSYANEIALLKKLRDAESQGSQASSTNTSCTGSSSSSGNRIIELIDYEVNREERYVAMLLEAGDTDLSKVLSSKYSRHNKMLAQQHNPASSSSGTHSTGSRSGSGSVSSNSKSHGKAATVITAAAVQYLDPFFARMVWKEMLEAVNHIHEHRIVHGDLKPANFVFVRGHLKLIDFGIAKSFSTDTTNIYRESQIGTINYMAPEAIAPMSAEEMDARNNCSNSNSSGNGGQGDDQQQPHCKMRLGRASDIWSLGCILYQMNYGRPPFAALNTIQKLTTIPNPNHVINYPDGADMYAVESMKACLVHDPRKRSKIAGDAGLLTKPYLQIHAANPTATEVTMDTDPAATTVTQGQRLQSEAAQIAPSVPAVPMDQLENVVSAVIAALSETAQRDTAVRVAQLKQQVVSTVATRTRTRNGSTSTSTSAPSKPPAAVLAAEKFGKEVNKWLQGIDVEAVHQSILSEVSGMCTTNTVVSTASTCGAAPAANSTTATTPAVVHAAATAQQLSTSAAITGPGGASRSMECFVDSQFRESSTSTSSAYHREGVAHISNNAENVGREVQQQQQPRPPLKILPDNIRNQIQRASSRKSLVSASSSEAEGRVAKWVRPAEASDGSGQDMRSILEKRIGEMRKFLDVDQDNITATETLEITGINEYF